MHRLVVLLLILLPFWCAAQTVGLVLSGGGATGQAHVGVLKALEEKGIPIDYITGTSIGALVGGLYAAGFSPAEIEAIVKSEKFTASAKGQIDDQYVFYFRKPKPSAGWVSIRTSPDSSFLQSSIPTSFINPAALDFDLMQLFDPASRRSGYDFDSLFIPFRCVASDIQAKQSVVFDSGNLNTAVRASMSYPLYLKPLSVNGKLLFDGGLYNNFPTELMRNAFNPDIIIGSNVSGNEDAPREDDFVSQLRNMVISQSNYELKGDSGILIEPVLRTGTFEFDRQQENIDSGYAATMRKMDEIKQKVHRRVHQSVVDDRRRAFNAGKAELIFTEYNYLGLSKSQEAYVASIMRSRRPKPTDVSILKRRYFRLYENDKIERLFPYATPATDGYYRLNLEVKKEKKLLIEFGGNLSTRPINTGFVGVGFTTMKATGISYYANSYFGKLYASVLAQARIDLPTRLPLYIEPLVCINRWNYFKSQAAFFEDNNSLFLIQNERFGALNASFALSNKTKWTLGGSVVSLRDNYYQVSAFGQDDVADNTVFEGSSFHAAFERNSQNRKQYSNAGSALRITARYTMGEETYSPGSTSSDQLSQLKNHKWFQACAHYESFYRQKGSLRLGISGHAVYSDMAPFSNYTASLLRAPAFEPTSESMTLFLPSFRAFQYASVGHHVVINMVSNLDLMLNAHLFQPYKYLERVATNTPNVRTVSDFDKRFGALSANLVFTSPLGPISFSANYYPRANEIVSDLGPNLPVTLLFHFGYVLFNERALR